MRNSVAKLLRKVAATEATRNPRWRKSYRRLKSLWQTLPKSKRFDERMNAVFIVANAGGVA